MLIQTDTGPGYTAVWSLMHERFVPCKENIAKLGNAYEAAKKRFRKYADNRHDYQDVDSAEIYTILMEIMDDAHKKLKPFKNQWWIVRHGLGLN